MAKQLSEKEIQQRRDAAKARWDKVGRAGEEAVSGAAGASMGVQGAALGGLVGLQTYALADKGAESRSPFARGTVGRKIAAFKLKRDKGYREKVKAAGSKARAEVRSGVSAPKGGVNAKAEAAKRKVMEEAASRGGDMKQAAKDADAAFARVASRKKGAKPAVEGSKVSDKVRAAIDSARKNGGGVRIEAAGTKPFGPDFGSIEQSAVRSAMRRTMAQKEAVSGAVGSLRTAKAKPLVAAIIGGAVASGIASAHSTYHDTRDNFRAASQEKRKGAINSAGVASGALGATAGIIAGAKTISYAGQKGVSMTSGRVRAVMAGAMAAGAVGGAALGRHNQRMGFEFRDRMRAEKASMKAQKSDEIAELAKSIRSESRNGAIAGGVAGGVGGLAVALKRKMRIKRASKWTAGAAAVGGVFGAASGAIDGALLSSADRVSRKFAPSHKSDDLADLAKAYKKSRLRRTAEHAGYLGAAGAGIGAGVGLAGGIGITSALGTAGTKQGARMTRAIMRRGAGRLGRNAAIVGGIIGAIRGPKKS